MSGLYGGTRSIAVLALLASLLPIQPSTAAQVGGRLSPTHHRAQAALGRSPRATDFFTGCLYIVSPPLVAARGAKDLLT